jgi:hypothetical protein
VLRLIESHSRDRVPRLTRTAAPTIEPRSIDPIAGGEGFFKLEFPPSVIGRVPLNLVHPRVRPDPVRILMFPVAHDIA